MGIQLNLPADLVMQLIERAQQLGVSTDEFAAGVFRRELSQVDRTAAAAMLEDWARAAEAMSDEDAEANERVLRAIDADRLSERRLFDDVLGKTAR